MVKCCKRDGGSDSDVFCKMGQMHSHNMNRWTDAVGRKMVLSQPDSVVACLIHDLDIIGCALINSSQRDASAWPTEEL